ncbi:MAG: DNA polymerase III subunit beta [Phycisphaerae bacterium]|nr:DNA polymerase III subunit beta [Phycisphaerae bacterium]MDD5380554.1 DNA polymerase III subunit beta [Phycisphaerae bacterium]
MRLNFNRAALADALGILTTVVPSRTPKPILHCVQIVADKKNVHICATDIEVGINYLVSEVQVEEAGEIVVPADRLAAVVRESTDDVLVLRAEDGTCKIEGADSHFTIYGQEPGQYPAVPSFEAKADIEISLGCLQAGIRQCLFATAKESTRYALNGVLWEIKGKKLSLVATDGRRLARCRASLASAPAEQIAKVKVIVPAKTMTLLDKIGGSEKDIVMVKLVDNQILFSCANVVISSNLVEGNFPKYEDIIPEDYDKKLVLSTEAVLSAVRRSALLTSGESRGIKLSIGKNSLMFSGRAPEAGDAQINMPIDYKGEPIEIGFNPQFLIEALRVIKTAEFELELGQADRPGLIKSGANFLYVLMPINLS